MTTHLTKIWWDLNKHKLVEQVISEAEIYKVALAGTPQEVFAMEVRLGANEVLRVTKDGQFIWHEDADRMIEEGDFSFSPAMPHILKALRKQRKPLTDEQIEQSYRHICRNLPDDFDYTSMGWIEQGIKYAEQAHGIKGEA